MFKHGFPPEWSTLKKLIWLVGSGIAGAASGIWKTVTGALIHITDALSSPMQKCEVSLEPIQSGSGDPSPTNVRPITGWTGCEVNVSNENLFDKSKVGTLGILTWAYENGGILLKAGQSYVLSVASAGSSGLVDSISIFTANKATQLANSYSKTLVYTPTADIKVCFRFYKSTGVTQEAIDTVQLNLGTTALPYEDHNGTTFSVTFPDTVFGGSYEFVSGVGSDAFAKIIFNGTENWTKSGSALNGFFIYVNNPPKKSYGTILSDKFKTVTTSTEYFQKYGCCYSDGAINISIDPSLCGGNTVQDFKTWLSSNNVEIVYERAESVSFTGTPQPISTLKGENNVWGDGNIEMTYKAQAE